MVGHNMRLAAYLSASRHGIYYFRWPIPVDLHSARRRTHVTVSLGTRNLSRLLVVAAQSYKLESGDAALTRDTMKTHMETAFRLMVEQEAAVSKGYLSWSRRGYRRGTIRDHVCLEPRPLNGIAVHLAADAGP
jgi:hypothetical protein